MLVIKPMLEKTKKIHLKVEEKDTKNGKIMSEKKKRQGKPMNQKGEIVEEIN